MYVCIYNAYDDACTLAITLIAKFSHAITSLIEYATTDVYVRLKTQQNFGGGGVDKGKRE